MILNPQKVSRILRRHGFKMTPQRRAILEVINASPDHLTPAEIYRAVTREVPGTGLVTIYRTLKILSDLGLICEVHVGGRGRNYLLRRPLEHHHHLICSECGRVIDFTGCDLSGIEQRLSRETGFKMEAHLLEFLGRCPDCQQTLRGRFPRENGIV